MKSVAWLLSVEKYQNQMKILDELPDGFKKEYFKNKYAYSFERTVLSIFYDLEITLCQSQIIYYSMLSRMIKSP